MISIIVAFDEDRAIAKEGKIPWHIKEDMEHFKKTTMGGVVILGRKTWDSLPMKNKPLPGRKNIILTRSKGEGVIVPSSAKLVDITVVNCFESALSFANEENKEIFIIGGLQVYQEALASGKVDRVVASHIKGHFGGDLFFPELTGWHRRLVQSFEEFEVYEHTH